MPRKRRRGRLDFIDCSDASKHGLFKLTALQALDGDAREMRGARLEGEEMVTLGEVTPPMRAYRCLDEKHRDRDDECHHAGEDAGDDRKEVVDLGFGSWREFDRLLP